MKTVLFVDDSLKNPQIFQIMRQIFNHEGLRVEGAYDAEDTKKKATELSPDIMLIKMNNATLDILKQNAESAKKLPAIVLLPAKSSASYAQKMKDNGATDAINMDTASILQIIDKVKQLINP